MGNQQVKQCRFYVDMYSYYHAVGYHNFFTEGDIRFLYLDPTIPNIAINDYWASSYKSYFYLGNSIETTETSNLYAGLPAFPINAIGMFNHNLGNNSNYVSSAYIKLRWRNNSNQTKILNSNDYGTFSCTNDINGSFDVGTYSGIEFTPYHNGWSMTHLNDSINSDSLSSTQWGPISYNYKSSSAFNTAETNPLTLADTHLHIGSWFVGTYWDTPHTPNLTLTMKRTFDGIKTLKSLGDKTFTKFNYDGVTDWIQYHAPETINDTSNTNAYFKPRTYNIPSMEFTGANKNYLMDDGSNNADALPREYYGEDYQKYMAKKRVGRKGKRVWNLAFDYISDTDMWIEKEYSSNVSLNDNGSDDIDYSPQINDYSFQWVWTHTLGGSIPFLFCPDKNLIETNSDLIQQNMVICTFDNKSLQVRQTAPNLYSISVVIREL